MAFDISIDVVYFVFIQSFLSSFLSKPTPEQIACQLPKPILLDVGTVAPIEWVPYILPLQVARVGNFWIVAVPSEFTTMSGRRLRDTVRQAIKDAGALTPDTTVVIAGLSNSYSHYTATYEEYQLQRYEGASTLYGPHTLDAYRQEYYRIATALATKATLPPGPTPVDMRNHTFSFQPGVVLDDKPLGKDFGSIDMDVSPAYSIGMFLSTTP